MFKMNEEADRVMRASASKKEQFLFNRCYSFVNTMNREDEIKRRKKALQTKSANSVKNMHLSNDVDVRIEIKRNVKA